MVTSIQIEIDHGIFDMNMFSPTGEDLRPSRNHPAAWNRLSLAYIHILIFEIEFSYPKIG